MLMLRRVDEPGGTNPLTSAPPRVTAIHVQRYEARDDVKERRRIYDRDYHIDAMRLRPAFRARQQSRMRAWQRRRGSIGFH